MKFLKILFLNLIAFTFILACSKEQNNSSDKTEFKVDFEKFTLIRITRTLQIQ